MKDGFIEKLKNLELNYKLLNYNEIKDYIGIEYISYIANLTMKELYDLYIECKQYKEVFIYIIISIDKISFISLCDSSNIITLYDYADIVLSFKVDTILETKIINKSLEILSKSNDQIKLYIKQNTNVKDDFIYKLKILNNKDLTNIDIKDYFEKEHIDFIVNLTSDDIFILYEEIVEYKYIFLYILSFIDPVGFISISIDIDYNDILKFLSILYNSKNLYAIDKLLKLRIREINLELTFLITSLSVSQINDLLEDTNKTYYRAIIERIPNKHFQFILETAESMYDEEDYKELYNIFKNIHNK